MIFFDQFKVPTIKFGKCFAEFMILIALLIKWVINAELFTRYWPIMGCKCNFRIVYGSPENQ